MSAHYNIIWKTALSNYIATRVPVPSALKISRWQALLTDYHNRQLLTFLKLGWPADYSANHPPVHIMTNLGPFETPLYTPWAQTSPMKTRPKKNTDERQVIVDLSYPWGPASMPAYGRASTREDHPPRHCPE